ncbi:MAG: alpha-ketoacid dehydrogenase subunit beta [Thermoleophilaceae bacterium]|nr:alpha-ketoacid dehydrogenase subunit beta [Thermoleophilaceae bacterium]
MKPIRFAQAITQALDEEMARDEQVILLGEDIGKPGGSFGITKGLLDKYGESRVYDTPISEEAIVGAALGASMMGARPVVEIMFNDFAALAMDQIVNQAAKIHYMSGGRLSAPLVIRMLCGTNGSTAGQHSQSLEAWFTHVPGLKVVAPSTPADAKAFLKAAIRDPDPVMFFEQRMLYNTKGEVPDEVEPARLAEGKVVREGSDLTIAAYMKGVHQALEAAEILERDGISAEVWDVRSLVPFDRDGLRASLERTGRLMTVHEAVVRSGFGAEIAAIAAEEMFDLLKAPVRRVGAHPTPHPYAPQLESTMLPSVERIVETARELVGATEKVA